MEDEHSFNDWDLSAVVRLGCSRRRLSPPPSSKVNDPFDSLLRPPPPPPAAPSREVELANEQEADFGWRFPDLRVGGGGQDGGDELLKAYLAARPPMPPPLPTLPPPTTLPPPPQQQQKQPVVVPQAVEVTAQARPAPPPAPAPARAQPSGRQMPGAAPRSKRRKNQVKKVVRHVPADGSSTDVWAWRKYGQKPIKGSPYPRGYYRCSSSKGCPARKQVERCRTDPGTFILTYTGEHNHAAPTHRNSLAGTTRHKFPSTAASSPPPPEPSVAVGSSESEQQQQQPTPSAPSAGAGLSPTTPLRTPSMEEDDDVEEEEELLVEDMEMAGEDELVFLNGDADSAAAPMEPMTSLFDVVDEPFLGSPWTTAGSSAAGAAGAGC